MNQLNLRYLGDFFIFNNYNEIKTSHWLSNQTALKL